MEKEQLDLSKYRLEKANDDLAVSRLNLDNKKYSQSINRSYYAMFHAVRALLALEGFDTRKHSGIISHFNHYYVKSGIIELEYSKMLTTAFKFRNDSDYDDFFVASADDAKLQYQNANKFIKRIVIHIMAIVSADVEEE